MDFALDEEQRLLQATVARLMAEEYGPAQRRARLHAAPGFSEALWKRYAELGLLGLLLPEEFGGSARSFVDAMVVLQGFGRALPLEPFLATVVLGAGIVNDAGSIAQKRLILPAVAAGACKLALAHGEREARYQVTRVGTRARRTAGGWSLHGAKTVVLHGDAADWLIVSARTAGEVAAADGISLFLVPPRSAGLEMRRYRTIDGLGAADLMLADVEVPADACLGVADEAAGVLQAAHDRAVAAVCAEAVGIMEALFDATLAHLKSRRQFGVVIGSFQALQHRMAEMLVHLEQARSMACLAALSVEDPEGRVRRRRLAAAKIQIGRSGRFIGQQSVQLHGGVGVTDAYFVGHLFKRLTMIDRVFGDVDHHLDRFAEADDIAGNET